MNRSAHCAWSLVTPGQRCGGLWPRQHYSPGSVLRQINGSPRTGSYRHSACWYRPWKKEDTSRLLRRQQIVLGRLADRSGHPAGHLAILYHSHRHLQWAGLLSSPGRLACCWRRRFIAAAETPTASRLMGITSADLGRGIWRRFFGALTALIHRAGDHHRRKGQSWTGHAHRSNALIALYVALNYSPLQHQQSLVRRTRCARDRFFHYWRVIIAALWWSATVAPAAPQVTLAGSAVTGGRSATPPT